MYSFYEKSMVLAGKQMALLNAQYKTLPKSLADFEFKVFSQFGEDGILDWLVEKLSPMPEVFIEFGVENYEESNTRFLLLNRNWRGLVMDGSQSNVEFIQNSTLYWQRDLTAKTAFITRENIEEIIEQSGFAGEIGILSIDLDGNDYWVWEAISNVNPHIVVCEFSTVFGDVYPITIPYMKNFTRMALHHSGQYFGASIPALLHLAEQKGYTCVGTASTGVNAFFVRNDLAAKIRNILPEAVLYPARHSDTRAKTGQLTYLRGQERLNLIGRLPVVNVVSGETQLIKQLPSLYSEAWQNKMKGY